MYIKIKERRRAKVHALSGATAAVRVIPVDINRKTILAQNTLNTQSSPHIHGLSIHNFDEENNLQGKTTDFNVSATNKALITAKRGLDLNTDNSQIGQTVMNTGNQAYQDWLLTHEARSIQRERAEASPLNRSPLISSPNSAIDITNRDAQVNNDAQRRVTFLAGLSSNVVGREPLRLTKLRRSMNKEKTDDI